MAIDLYVLCPFMVYRIWCNPVLLKSCHGGAMVEWRHGILEKCHKIVVALRVAYGGAMAAAIAMAVMAESREWRNNGFFILKNIRDRGWADPSQPYPSFSSGVTSSSL